MNGPAIGIAVTSLSHFDVVYMAEGGYLWTPFARAGLYPEFASSIMFPKLMGDHVAMEMLLLSKKLSAEEANNCGFVNELFPAGEGFEAAVLARLAEQLEMSGPPGDYQRETFMQYKALVKKDVTLQEIQAATVEENALQAQRQKDGTAEKAREYLSKIGFGPSAKAKAETVKAEAAAGTSARL